MFQEIMSQQTTVVTDELFGWIIQQYAKNITSLNKTTMGFFVIIGKKYNKIHVYTIVVLSDAQQLILVNVLTYFIYYTTAVLILF